MGNSHVGSSILLQSGTGASVAGDADTLIADRDCFSFNECRLGSCHKLIFQVLFHLSISPGIVVGSQSSNPSWTRCKGTIFGYPSKLYCKLPQFCKLYIYRLSQLQITCYKLFIVHEQVSFEICRVFFICPILDLSFSFIC